MPESDLSIVCARDGGRECNLPLVTGGHSCADSPVRNLERLVCSRNVEMGVKGCQGLGFEFELDRTEGPSADATSAVRLGGRGMRDLVVLGVGREG